VAERKVVYLPPRKSTGDRAGRVLAKVLATFAVWSIALVMGWRLRHPMADLALLGLAVAVTVVIWLHPDPPGGN
jgi:hypothetical protein